MSAAILWLSSQGQAFSRPAPRASFPSEPGIKELELFRATNLLQDDDTKPLHILVPAKTHTTYSASSPNVHYLRRKLPQRSLMERCSDEKLFTVSPELCFLQIASICDFATTVRFGSELCSLFTRTDNPANPLAFRPPLTSREKIRSYLDASKGAPGIGRARRAEKHLVPRARSPREVELGMMLFLPCKEGGFGITPATLNESIGLGRRNASLDRRTYFECDFLWRNERLVLEYDSDFAHTTQRAREKDASKRNALSALGYTVLSATPGQVSTYAGMVALAKTVSHHLGRRVRKYSEQQERGLIALWKELFANSTPSVWLEHGLQNANCQKNWSCQVKTQRKRGKLPRNDDLSG